MKKNTILAIIAMLAILSTLSASPKHGMDCKGGDCSPQKVEHHKGQPHKEMFEDLKLTADQQKQIEDIHAANKKQVIDIDADIKKKEIDLFQAKKGEEFKKAEKLIDEIAKLKAQKQKNKLTTEKNVLKILNPEQKEKYKKVMSHKYRKNMMPHKKPAGKHRAKRKGC